MTTVRCPSCDAAVPADAAWCTLCFARLHAQAAQPATVAAEPLAAAPVVPEPAPVPLPAVVTAPVLSAPVPTAPMPSMPQPADPLSPFSAVTATAVVVEPMLAWPCSGCSEQVPFEETVCPRCGTEFMGGVNPNVSLKVPGVGDLVGMSAGAKFGVMAGGATVLATVLVLILLVLGHIF